MASEGITEAFEEMCILTVWSNLNLTNDDLIVDNGTKDFKPREIEALQNMTCHGQCSICSNETALCQGKGTKLVCIHIRLVCIHKPHSVVNGTTNYIIGIGS